MSLLIYLIAFLYQVSLRPANRLTTESISVIFGPSLLGTSRSAGQANNGINSSKASSEGLRWLLENWEDSLSQDLLDEDYDCFASPFLGQTAWSTPNILGEMHSSPFIAAQSSTKANPRDTDEASPTVLAGQVQRDIEHETIGVPPDTSMHTASADPRTIQDSSEISPEAPDLSPPESRDMNALASSTPAASTEHNINISNVASQGSRSVSGFAKGEHFTDEDITSDPNAAQLFGSLSQLFTTERRKARAYQQQLEELQSRHQGLESTIASLQTALAQGNQRQEVLDSEIVNLKGQIHAFEDSASRSANETLQQQEALDATRKDLEKLKVEHEASLRQADTERAALQDQHARNIEEHTSQHQRELQDRERTLAEAHEKDKALQQERLSAQHQEELRRLHADFEDEKLRMVQEIQQLREAVQISDKERDNARVHLQRIRALLDAAAQ